MLTWIFWERTFLRNIQRDLMRIAISSGVDGILLESDESGEADRADR